MAEVNPEFTKTPFLPKETFMQQNAGPIGALFKQLASDFSDRDILIDGQTFSADDALQLGDSGELTPTTKAWLNVYAVGGQHGYDRPEDRKTKIFIEPGDPTYMNLISDVSVGELSFVSGGQTADTPHGRSILVGGGFPHLNAGRLRAALRNDYDNLWDIANVSILSGQRRRWNDNEQEDTAETVINKTASFSGIDMSLGYNQGLIDGWRRRSFLAREQDRLQEGPAWQQPYATEADMARLAIEFALLQVNDGLFNWGDYSVKEHFDEYAEDLNIDDFHVPARKIKAWEYVTSDNRSFYVINGKAVPRDNGGEPRPTSASVADESYDFLKHSLSSRENIIAFGAPHIRAGYHTASRLILAAEAAQYSIAPLHLSMAAWEYHEPPVTGIANILGMDAVDTKLRKSLTASKTANS